MTEIFKNLFASDTPIKDVIKKMGAHEENKFIPGFAVLIDGSNKVIGSVTDGDVRRGLTRGISIEQPISEIANSSPVLVSGNLDYSRALNIVAREAIKRNKSAESFSKIIFVDDENRFVDVITYEELARDNISGKTVAVYGLGFVGLTLATVMASNQFLVTGYDCSEQTIGELNSERLPFRELDLESLFETIQLQNPINFTSALELVEAEIHIVSVDVPLDSDDKVDLQSLCEVISQIAKKLKKEDVVIVRSTVPVGTTRQVLLPLLEMSNLKAGKEFYLAFAPERAIEGDALNELETVPQVVGGLDVASTKKAVDIFKKITTVVEVQTLEEAELIKLVNNTYRDLVFGFANEVSMMCEAYNIDAHRLIDSANEGYPRNFIPSPGAGVGGPYLTRDPYIFEQQLKSSQYTPLSGKTSRTINNNMLNNLTDKIRSYEHILGKPLQEAKIFVLGITFKGQPETTDIRNSVAIEVCEKLAIKDTVIVKDFALTEKEVRELGFQAVSDIYDGFKGTDVVLVMNNNYQNNKINIKKALALMSKPAIFFDAWNLFNGKEIERYDNVYYSTPGYTTRRFYQVASLKRFDEVIMEEGSIKIDLSSALDVHNDAEFLHAKYRGRYFWVSGGGSYLINNRYLPVVQRHLTEKVNPGAFSIFTGRSDCVAECLNPRLMLRELFEELIIFDQSGVLKPILKDFQGQIDHIYNRLVSIFKFNYSEQALVLQEKPLKDTRSVTIQLDGQVNELDLSLAFSNKNDLNALFLFSLNCEDIDALSAKDGEVWNDNGAWQMSDRKIYLLDLETDLIKPFDVNAREWVPLDKGLMTDNLKHLLENI